MPFKMEKCPHCGKSMPKHILVKHLVKSHSDINVGKEEKPILESHSESSEGEKWYEKWDAGEIGTCAQCKTQWPAKLMGFHLRFEHGL